MTKSDRHKKLRRKEKAKTQLTGVKKETGVKKLAKCQNIIEPTFRAKKILIREQLQGPTEGETVQITRNKTLTDVLNSLSHHNTNIKKDAMLGLQEIISTQPEALFANLDKILEKIGALAANEEGSIRKENLQMAELVFAKLTEDQMKPFWNLLISYVKCSLTHLNSFVRKSCIQFISLLLTFFPNLMSSSFHILLPSVLGLISSGAGKSKGFQVQPQLKLEISSKEHSYELRIKVLKFLASCIDLHVSQTRARKEAELNHLGTCTSIEWENAGTFRGLNYSYGYQETQVKSPYQYDSSSLNGSTAANYLWSDGTSHQFSSGETTEIEFWPQFVNSCLPILYQTWLEVRPLSLQTTGKPLFNGLLKDETDL